MSPITISVAIIISFMVGVVFTSVFWYTLLRRYINVVENYEVINQAHLTALGTQAAITKDFMHAYRLDEFGGGSEVPE